MLVVSKIKRGKEKKRTARDVGDNSLDRNLEEKHNVLKREKEAQPSHHDLCKILGKKK